MLKAILNFLQNIIERNRIIFSFVGGVSFIYFSKPTMIAILIGTPLILLGEAIRTWASGFINKNKDLAKEGPYAFTRNPLYLGNFFIGIGFSIMSNNLIILYLFVKVFTIVYVITIKNEEKYLLSKFGDAFLEYKNKVPVFFPVKMTQSNFSLNFDWQLVKKHREHHTRLGVAGCITIFVLKAAY